MQKTTALTYEPPTLPLVTLAIWSHNHVEFIRPAVAGAFAQDYPNLEIILSDDCSVDGTFEQIQDMAAGYKGSCKLIVNQNPVNLGSRGIGLHINRIMELSHGELVVFASGDDVARPNRASTLVNKWIKAGRPTCAMHSAVEIFSSDGIATGVELPGMAEFGSQSVYECVRAGATGVLGASLAITRGIYDGFGPLPELILLEDRTLAFRALLVGSILYCPEILVDYRRHEDALSGDAIYSQSARWEKWSNCMIGNLECFRRDYLSSLATNPPDKEIILQIEKGKQRVMRTCKLVTGNPFERGLSAYYYSSSFRANDRLVFILHRMGLQDTFVYRIPSFLWRLKSRFI